MSEFNKVNDPPAGGDFTSDEIFPNIDAHAIALKLKVEQEGKSRGAQDLPNSADKNNDVIETQIISNVSELRRQGLKKYEDCRNTYQRRLNEIQLKNMELAIFARKVETDYEKEIKVSENSFANEIDRVRNYSNEIEEFKRRNKIWRTPSHKQSLAFTIGFVGILVAISAAINAYFLAYGNEQIRAVGIISAFLFASVNVGISMIWGRFSRNIVHVNYARKLAGLLALAGFVVISVGLNLFLAHFGNFIKTQSWREATVSGLEQLENAPFRLGSVELWLLCGIGIIVSVIALVKAWRIDDRYPGYGKAYRRWESASKNYAGAIESTITDLTRMRDDAIEELKQGRANAIGEFASTNGICSSISALSSDLTEFLAHTNGAINQVMSKYRNANKAARSSAAPLHFDEAYQFEKYVDSKLEEPLNKPQIEAHAVKINAIIEASVDKIFDSFTMSVDRVLGSKGRLL